MDLDHIKRKRVIYKARSFSTNVLLLCLGSAVMAVGVNGILTPKQFLSGGVLGISLILHYLMPVVSVGVSYFIINIPLVLLGWFNVGRRFILYTAIGVAAFSFFAEIIKPPPFTVENPILAAMLAGIIVGLGAGIVFRSAGSCGGADILAVYFNKKYDFRMGWTYSGTNALIFLCAAFVFNLETALYAMIYSYVSGKVVDAVMTGFNTRKQVFIISDKSREIAHMVMKKMDRGVTYLKGEGAFTGREKSVVFTIVTLMELGKIKDLVYEIDPESFVVINDTLEVLGRRHGARRVY